MIGLDLGLGRARISSAAPWFSTGENEGSTLVLDFVNQRYAVSTDTDSANMVQDSASSILSCIRSGARTAKDSSNNDIAFGVNELRITDLGLYCEDDAGGSEQADDIKFLGKGWFDGALGTFLIEWEQIAASVGTQNILRWNETSSVWSRVRAGTSVYMQLQDAIPTLIFNGGMGSAASLGIHKISCAVAPDDMAIARSASLDGGISTDNSGTPFSNVSDIRLGGNSNGNEMLNGRLRSVTYWPVRKTNAQLQAIV